MSGRLPVISYPIVGSESAVVPSFSKHNGPDSVTVKLQVSINPPSLVLTTIDVVPSFIGVIVPSPATVAIDGLVTVHVTDLSVAVDGEIVYSTFFFVSSLVQDSMFSYPSAISMLSTWTIVLVHLAYKT